jgi:hypothetical protein
LEIGLNTPVSVWVWRDDAGLSDCRQQAKRCRDDEARA